MTGAPGVTIDVKLVERLVAAQFPQWSHLPVSRVAQGGWDNRTFHLGPEMTVRLPSWQAYVAQVEKEHAWLPRLAPDLPLPIPVPLAKGAPGEGYPWAWSIYGWIEGETAAQAAIADLNEFAVSVAGFLRALQSIDATQGPAAGAHNFHRGGALRTYDAETWAAIETLGHTIERGAASAIWEDALASRWDQAPVWVHGDVAATNLLVRDGRLSAVIDFGIMGVGDPACDLAIAWTLLDADSRQAFRQALAVDAATWARGRGWVLWKALIVLARQGEAKTAEVEFQKRALAAVIADHALENG